MDYIHDHSNVQLIPTRNRLNFSVARKKRCRISEHKQADTDRDSDITFQKRKRHKLSDFNQAQDTVFGKTRNFVHTSNTSQIIPSSSIGAASATNTTVGIQVASCFQFLLILYLISATTSNKESTN